MDITDQAQLGKIMQAAAVLGQTVEEVFVRERNDKFEGKIVIKSSDGTVLEEAYVPADKTETLAQLAAEKVRCEGKTADLTAKIAEVEAI